jgi:hypothetical protein
MGITEFHKHWTGYSLQKKATSLGVLQNNPSTTQETVNQTQADIYQDSQ